MKLKPLTASFLVSLSAAIGWQPSVSYAAGPQTSVLEAANQAFNFSCIDYQIAGMCLWLRCGWKGCSVRSSLKVKHYIPDLVVQVYSDGEEMPISDVDTLMPELEVEIGNETINTRAGGTNAIKTGLGSTSLKTRAADAFGNPMSAVFEGTMGGLGLVCAGNATPYKPYFISSLDHLAWRGSLPEMFHYRSLNPFDNMTAGIGNTWGNLYPRNGYIEQADDYKASAVVAQRVGNIVTQTKQPHVYQSLTGRKRTGYWPPAELKEGDKNTGKWQMLLPRNENSCKIFPHDDSVNERQRSKYNSYVWNLWRPYSCCKRAGQFFITDI